MEEKQAFDPRETAPPEQEPPRGGSVLRMQLILTMAILAGLLLLGRFAPQRQAALLAPYRSYMAAHDISTKPVVRFASAVVEGLLPTAKGGSGQAQKPWNYSTESYQPPVELAQPLGGYQVTSGYGWRKNPTASGKDFHTGIDLAAAEGSRVLAAEAGVVVRAGWSKSYGNYIVLCHHDHLITLYAHLQYLFVRTGQPVGAGQLLGTVGQTGNATGPHLHFELLYKDIGYDPGKALGV